MSLKKMVFLPVLMFFGFSCAAFAQYKSEAEAKMAALSVVKKYAEAVSCGHSFEEAKSLRPFLSNVYTMSYDEEMGSTFYVLWYGDLGCNGGSGTTSFMVSDVTSLGGSRPLLVSEPDVFNKVFSEKINSRFIESMKKVGEYKFLIVSSEFDKSDESLNFPSNKYAYTVELGKNEWKVTSRKFLGKKTY